MEKKGEAVKKTFGAICSRRCLEVKIKSGSIYCRPFVFPGPETRDLQSGDDFMGGGVKLVLDGTG